MIEPSAGVDRALLAFLCDALEVETLEGNAETVRTVLRIDPRLAPVKAAVYPLVKKDRLPELARELFSTLKRRMNVMYDEKDSIGRRYRRADEVGVPVSITVDAETLRDRTVTVRDRDSLQQERVRIEDSEGFLTRKLGSST